MLHRSVMTATAILSVSSGCAALGQDAEAMVDVRFTGLAEIEPASKDAAAHAALQTLGSRLRLLPREIPDFEADRKWIDAGWKLLTASGGLSIWADGDLPTVSLSLAPSGGTDGVLEALAGFIDAEQGPGAYTLNEDGSVFIEAPGGGIHLGNQLADGRDAFTLRFNQGPVAPVAPERFGLPADQTPIISASIDVGGLMTVLQDVMLAEEPQAAEQMDRLGFFGGEDTRLQWAVGTGSGLATSSARLTNAKPWLSRFFGDTSFQMEDFRVVPKDATIVAGTCSDFAWTLDLINVISEDTGRDLLGQVREGFGIDLEGGLLANIGPRWIYYQSQTTGGGGLLSAVIVAELRDPDAFRESHAAALVHVNQFGSALGRGYARSREWQLEGRTVWSAVFPGLPVPIEPSWTVAGDRLVLAATPVALTAAVAQLGNDRSAVDSPMFTQALGDQWPGDPVLQVNVINTEWFARQGYGPTSLAASALANLVRQPFNAAAEPGTLMPTFMDFVQGVQPTGVVTTWDGQDLVQRATLDGSALVQISAAVSQTSAWQSAYLPGLAAGTMLPAIGQARESAQQVKSAAQIRGVIQAAMVLQQDDPEALVTIDELLENELITPDMLVSPMGEAWDGGPNIVLREQFGDTPMSSFDATLVIAMDRASYVNGEDVVNIGFADGRVEGMDYWEVADYLDLPKNAGLREEWGLD